ncbi:MAG: dimethylmenaquinone methyltransferase [Pseudomonadota bacterium]
MTDKSVPREIDRNSSALLLAGYGTATVVDACSQTCMLDVDWIALMPACSIAGPALTVRCIAGDNLSIHAAMAEVRAGDVMVITGGENSSVALVGDMIGTQLKARGAAGVLLNGPVRDIEALRKLELPVWARSIRPKGPVKQVYGSVGSDIIIAGVRIRSGDWVVLDADGAVLVPFESVHDAIDSARKRHDGEVSKRPRYAAGEIAADILDLHPLIESQRSSGKGQT